MVDSYRYLSQASTAIVKMMIATAPREPVPWTPLSRPLSEARIALVSTAAPSMRDDRPFDTEGERANPWWGDPSYRVIPRTATEQDVPGIARRARVFPAGDARPRAGGPAARDGPT
jgi:hypothetical protein